MSAFSRLLIPLAWFLATCNAATASNETGILDIDLVFPRNESYAPSPLMPIVFGFSNAELGRIVNPVISFDLWSQNENLTKNHGTIWYLRWANWSGSDPFLRYGGWYGFNTEDHWMLNWRASWSNCTQEKTGHVDVSRRSEGGWVRFTIKNSSQSADLDAITNSKTCPPSNGGVSLNITEALHYSPGDSQLDGEYCAVLAPTTATPSPCAMKVDAAAASSISATITSKACVGNNTRISCPAEEENLAQTLKVGGTACLAIALGMLGFILR